MRKLLMASAALFLFSTSIMIFQISCSKTANAGTLGTNFNATKLLCYEGLEGLFKVDISNGAKSIFIPNLPSGYLDYKVQSSVMTVDNSYVYFIASKPVGSSKNTIVFKTDFNGQNPVLIFQQRDVDAILPLP
jgi:hypothetical protein